LSVILKQQIYKKLLFDFIKMSKGPCESGLV
jgi:hypothetical protein